MKRKDYLKEIRALSDAELQERANTIAEEAMKLRFRKKVGQLEQSHQMNDLRKNLARVRTELAARNAQTMTAEATAA